MKSAARLVTFTLCAAASACTMNDAPPTDYPLLLEACQNANWDNKPVYGTPIHRVDATIYVPNEDPRLGDDEIRLTTQLAAGNRSLNSTIESSEPCQGTAWLAEHRGSRVYVHVEHHSTLLKRPVVVTISEELPALAYEAEGAGIANGLRYRIKVSPIGF